MMISISFPYRKEKQKNNNFYLNKTSFCDYVFYQAKKEVLFYGKSKDVAQMLGKRHDNLLREIRNYVKKMGAEATDYFTEIPTSGRGVTFSVTEAGCELLGSRLLGDAGREYREWYKAILGNQPENSPQTQDEAQKPPEVKEYSFSEVAEILGVSERSVRRYIEAGKLEASEKEVMIPTVKKFVTEDALEAFKSGREA